MRPSLACALVAVSLGCSLSADRSALNTPDDASIVVDTSPEDTGQVSPVDTGTAPPVDVPRPPVDTGRADTGVDTGVARVDTGVDVTLCPVCPPSSPPSFCPGAGLCVDYAGCSDRCLACLAPELGGENCASVVTIAARGASTTVLSTCGRRDDLTVGCGTTGNDVVFRVRVAVRGALTVTATSPAGTRVSMGYNLRSSRCLETAEGCVGSTGASQRYNSRDVMPGDYYFYVGTDPSATVVVDVQAP